MTDADDAQYHSIANPRRTTLLHRSALDAFAPHREERDAAEEQPAA
ncbi:hypothetical protein ACFQBY_10900 [Promicromonospora citrea]|uniref:Uncharacterized protein n=1 Tax=Promicromonospora citrea TaxID=43677 RepID=A0A8H9GMG5_9MICO|nr:hypothetical protein [Promicromonospora citrea]NNH50828.1 hypothetical protein [Promicromonospora citrea]GGM35681.1 hypothetical protein GCM10010102_33780 [Promicromonospora citrea]